MFERRPLLLLVMCGVTRMASLHFGQNQQGGLALGVAVGLGDHRGGDQAAAVLGQSVAKIGQMRLLAISLFPSVTR